MTKTMLFHLHFFTQNYFKIKIFDSLYSTNLLLQSIINITWTYGLQTEVFKDYELRITSNKKASNK